MTDVRILFEFDETSMQTVEQFRAQGQSLTEGPLVHPSTGELRILLIPEESTRMAAEAEGREPDTQLYEYCARCERAMHWERAPDGILVCARCGNDTCYLCAHTYPVLRVCSRCGPQCQACQQALDAARYAFLREHARSQRLHQEGRISWYLPAWVCEGFAPTWDEAVDAAMHAAEGEAHGTA